MFLGEYVASYVAVATDVLYTVKHNSTELMV